jgi:hypothetical protein
MQEQQQAQAKAKSIEVGDRVRVNANSLFRELHGDEGEVVDFLDGSWRVRFMNGDQKTFYRSSLDKLSSAPAADTVNHPTHYTEHPSGVECIQITEHMGFNLGNAFKYIWRCDLKRDAVEDLRKAVWYVEREIALRERSEGLPAE